MNEPVIELTPLQRKVLRNVKEFLKQPPTLGRLYLKSIPSYAILFVFFGAMIWLLLSRDLVLAAMGIGGMALGAVLRDVGHFRRSVQVWPPLLACIDRKRLELLLDDATDEVSHDS